MTKATLLFPKDTVECRQGDYIISRPSQGKWQVFLVDDLVLLSRLVPLQFPHGVELIEEKDMMDSAKPARLGEIYLLVASYKKQFVSSDEAAGAIQNKTLGDSIPNLYFSISHFPRDRAIVVHGQPEP